MPSKSKEPIVVVNEVPAKRDAERQHHPPRRKKTESVKKDTKHGEKENRRSKSSGGEKARKSADVARPFLWRWATDKSEPVKHKTPISKEVSVGRDPVRHAVKKPGDQHVRRRKEVSRRDEKGSTTETVTRTEKERPAITRSVSHQTTKPIKTSSNSRPPLRRSKTSTRIEKPTACPPPIQTHKTEAREKPRPSSSGKRKRPSSVLASALHASKTKVPVRMVECVTCMDDFPASKGAYLKYCQHHWCESCIKRVFELSVKDIQQMPPKCCANKPIQPSQVNHLFNSAFRIAWNKKYEEWSSKDRLYCPRKNCGAWIKPEHIKSDKQGKKLYGECSKCKKKVCPKCNGTYHPSRSDCPKDPQLDAFIQTAKENGWQKCPECGITVERTEGCNHMTCPPPCKHEFCIICAAKWKTCNCPWFPNDEIERQRELAVPGAWPAAPQTYEEEMAARREQERQDENLARMMYELNTDENGNTINPYLPMPVILPGGGIGADDVLDPLNYQNRNRNRNRFRINRMNQYQDFDDGDDDDDFLDPELMPRAPAAPVRRGPGGLTGPGPGSGPRIPHRRNPADDDNPRDIDAETDEALDLMAQGIMPPMFAGHRRRAGAAAAGGRMPGMGAGAGGARRRRGMNAAYGDDDDFGGGGGILDEDDEAAAPAGPRGRNVPPWRSPAYRGGVGGGAGRGPRAGQAQQYLDPPYGEDDDDDDDDDDDGAIIDDDPGWHRQWGGPGSEPYQGGREYDHLGWNRNWGGTRH